MKPDASRKVTREARDILAASKVFEQGDLVRLKDT